MINRTDLYITPERSKIVREDIADGSEPEIRFYILVVVSTMIAAFGLVSNSTAVVIGAMLVAPLMTPIFGIALALIRSDARLLGRAMQAEVAGVVAAILMGFILGKIYPGLEPTGEMLARTQPQIFDLLVAILLSPLPLFLLWPMRGCVLPWAHMPEGSVRFYCFSVTF